MGSFLLVMNLLTGLCLCPFCCVFCDDNDTPKNITGRKGDNFTFPTGIDRRSNSILVWSFTTSDKESPSVIAQLYKDDAEILPVDQFQNRLYLDRKTGSLTIRGITFRDSGVYQLRITQIQESYKKFQLFVYADVGKPALKVSHHHSSTQLKTSCSVDCTVENGREVTLSWYRDHAMLNQTRSPDLSMTLRVPLEAQYHDNSILTCVAANPVSNHTVLLNITAICSGHSESLRSKNTYFLIGLVPILIACAVLLYCFIRKPKVNNSPELEPQYIDVSYKATNVLAKEMQHEDTLYSEVMPGTHGNSC